MQHLVLHHVCMLRKCLLAARTLVRLKTCLWHEIQHSILRCTMNFCLRNSPLCTKLWRCKLANCVNALLQMELRINWGGRFIRIISVSQWFSFAYHTKGRSPECALVCFQTLLWLGKCFPHNSHLYLLSVKCFAWWATISSLVSKRCWREKKFIRHTTRFG